MKKINKTLVKKKNRVIFLIGKRFLMQYNLLLRS